MKTQKLKFQKSIFFLLVLSFLFTTGMKCKKENNLDPDGLPKATQTGANVFACKVNGENWISSKSIYDIGGSIRHDTLVVSGSNPSGETFFETYIIRINKFSNKKNQYQLIDTINYAEYATNKNCFKISQGYGVGSAKSTDGQIIFTKVDTQKKILSGTFWFNIPTDYCDTLHITDGRFDIRYY
ncbi:hypothetical protein I5M32_11860 [Pedobacter sp. SD-b]|uniref:Lipoprotein n=1 Tax=Pedobacter segetis TaxID=2793069 RepID=A0ABS1BL85_9SPHI|nr:DUF6252 family protein [Pedobacter segetis]MBK0383654.1 hypothetical protein [Pedobacter segetis]